MTNGNLFGTDGIRAKVGDWPLVPDFVLRLGLAAGSVLGKNRRGNTIVVGRDTRQSGPMLQSALTAGLLSSGISVVDAGVITTPGVAYLTRRIEAAAGVVISASHNPVHENGIKFFDQNGLKLSEAIETEIERQAVSPAGQYSFGPFGRSIDGRGMHELYVENLLAEHPDLRLEGKAFVLDCANGAASWFAPECLARLGARVIAIHASPTGLNINDCAGSEYTRRRPKELGRLVQQYGANCGLAFDGDADRVVLLTSAAESLTVIMRLGFWHAIRMNVVNWLLVLSSRQYMRNEGLVKFVQANQLHIHETPVGDKYVVEELLGLSRQSPEPNLYALGGEQAGHVVLLDKDHTTGDGIRTALFVIRAFVESGAGSLTQFADVIQKTPQVIASADVGNGPRLDRTALNELEKQSLIKLPSLRRINLRYWARKPNFAMLEADGEVSINELGRLA
jgi:phosphoglucosamine mutase